MNGTLNLGEYQKFSLYLVYVFFPLGQLGFIISLMAQAAASAGRVFEILDAQSEIVEKPGAIELPPIVGRLEFDNVTFRYFGSTEPGAARCQLRRRAGPDGSGFGRHRQRQNRSIINLIPRFYDASEGAVQDRRP